MNLKEFITLVEQMRQMQRLYFKSRSFKCLQESITLEKKVDEAIKAFKQDDRPQYYEQDLFTNS